MSSASGTLNVNNKSGNNRNGGKKSEEKRIPRPPNAFMIFGQQHRKILARQYPEFTNKQISKILGTEWGNMSPEDKSYYRRLADEAHAKHMKKYPGYYYSPLEARQRKAERKRKYLQKCGKRSGNEENQMEYNENVLAVESLSRDTNLIDVGNLPKDFTQELAEIQQGHCMRQIINHNGQLIPVYCHRSVYHEIHNPTNGQTVVSISLSPIEAPNSLFVPEPGRPERRVVKPGYVREASHTSTEDGGVAPSIYHVSSNDPTLALVDEIGPEESTSFEEDNDGNNSGSSVANDLSDLMSSYLPPMDNPSISVTLVASNSSPGQLKQEFPDADHKIRSDIGNPRVIVKKEPSEDSPFILSSVMDAMTSE